MAGEIRCIIIICIGCIIYNVLIVRVFVYNQVIRYSVIVSTGPVKFTKLTFLRFCIWPLAIGHLFQKNYISKKTFSCRIINDYIKVH